MIDKQSLRRLAEAAENFRYIYEAARNIDHPSYPGSDECEAWEDALYVFNEAANPAAIIELLDLIDDQTKDILHYHNESKGIKARLTAAEAVAEAAAEMVKCQRGGYLDFHLHYGKALKATEKALQEWRKAKEATP